ncbi:MAG: nucleotidyltransferase family protein [Oscillatoria sp. PMC 1051.18]|nr:nucleotidyltransferase family protein [Oscillatoria sp. PMC 1050.18]MEC5032236.1 nucleotidyltransferase family protein [Oscillatoria sp. PMC 1051.18]
MISSALESKLVNNTRPEGQLLLCCLRPQIDKAVTEHIHKLIQQELDWNYFSKLAEKHRVLPLLYYNLNLICPEAIPQEILSNLRDHFLANSQRNLIFTNELLRLLERFQKLDIRIIPYKGTVLAGLVYGNISLKQIHDLDIIIDRQDLPKIRELLISEGYWLKREHDQEQTFFNDSNQVKIDVHWGLTPVYFPLEVDFNRLWEQTKIVKFCQKNIVNLSSEDLLLILCLQIAKDCWERRQKLEHLAKVCDIAQLIYTCPNLNWSEVIAQAKSHNLTRIFHFGVFLAQELFAVNLPDSVRLDVEKDLVAVSLASQVCAELFGEKDTQKSPKTNSIWDFSLRMRQLIFYFQIREGLLYKIKYVLGIFDFLVISIIARRGKT